MSALAEPVEMASLGVRSTAIPTPREGVLFGDCERQVFARTNRLFAWFLPAQWMFAVALAVGVGRHSGNGAAGVTTAAVIGGLLTLPVLGLFRWRPYELQTRGAVALAEAGFSALLIHLTNGRVETHFHFFGALALLALYRDWRVLPVATIAMLLHHVLVGLYWPETVYREANLTVWRAFEHGGWLLFENAVLLWSCLISRREMREICHRQDEHQQLLDGLEQRVRDRTRDLESEMQARERTARELRQTDQHHRDLVARVPIGIFETTRQGHVNFANPYLIGLIGLPATFDVSTLSLSDGRLFPAGERERMWQRLEIDGEVRGFAATLHHFDGSPFEVVINARVKPRPTPGAELVCEGTVEDVTVRKRAERELHTLHSQLVLASRQAGMAEVATGVLHNVGNVLTSVNLIVHDVQDRLKATRLTHLHRVVEVLQREQPRLAEFLTQDGAGRQLPDFLARLDQHLTTENSELLADVEGLVRHFEHIREIIVTQQGSAQLFGVLETLSPDQLIEDALRLNAESVARHGIVLTRDFAPAAPVRADRHKALQILVNLIKNAKDALQALPPAARRVNVRVAPAGPDRVALSVQDNGPGIAPANLKRIFQHGFTTKPAGHGFGLHSSVLAAREMGGDLVAASAGAGQGATFTLTLPKAPDPTP